MAISPAQLLGVSLGRVRFEPNTEFSLDEIGNTRYEVNVDVGISDLQRDDAQVRASVDLRATIQFVEPNSSLAEGAGAEIVTGDEPSVTATLNVPFELELEVHGLFGWGTDHFPPDEALARGWLEYNGMYLLWPYLRSYVTMITAATHFPALTIYTMNVPQPPVIPPKDEVEPEEGSAEAAAVDSAGDGSGAES